MLATRVLVATCHAAASSVMSAREMSVRIRLARFGRTNRPFYRINVADSRSPRDGKFMETVGTYDPLPSRKDNMKEVRLNRERIEVREQQQKQQDERPLPLPTQSGARPGCVACAFIVARNAVGEKMTAFSITVATCSPQKRMLRRTCVCGCCRHVSCSSSRACPVLVVSGCTGQ